MNVLTRRAGRAALAAAAVAASALTLLAAGPGAASAATDRVAASAQPAVAGVSWHNLTLLNHWRSEKSYNGGTPGWAIRGGVVYLRGIIAQSPLGFTTSREFAVLPPAARPARKLYFIVDADGLYGNLDILTNGVMVVSSPAPLDAKSFTSLDGISFPASPTTGHPLTLLNGWASGQFNNGSPAFWQENGVVYLLGAVQGPSNVSSNEFAVLPPGARPARVLYINTVGSGSVLQAISISPNGVIKDLDSPGDTFASLAGISFPAAPATGSALTLLNGWASSQGHYQSGDPASWVRNGIVHLLGSLNQPSGTSALFAVLPPAARPAHELYFATYTNNGSFGWVTIYPNGQIFVSNFGGVGASQAYTSLATISYAVNS